MQNPSYQSVFKIAQEKLQDEKFLQCLKKRISLLMLLQKKITKDKDRILDSLNAYDFDSVYTEKVIHALTVGDLRTTDILKRNFSHLVWSFFTFKWGNFFNGGKQLGKAEVQQISDHSWECTPFQRTEEQARNRLLKGTPLVAGKVVTSMALCFVFASGMLLLFGIASPIVITISVILALCNGGVCLLSRGKAMVDCAGFEPEKQKVYDTIEENSQEKSNLRWGRKVFLGVITLMACISACASAWSGIVGMLAFFGIVVALSNPFVLAAVIGLAIIAGVSFYAFQAAGIEGNYEKFKIYLLNFMEKEVLVALPRSQ